MGLVKFGVFVEPSCDGCYFLGCVDGIDILAYDSAVENGNTSCGIHIEKTVL